MSVTKLYLYIFTCECLWICPEMYMLPVRWSSSENDAVVDTSASLCSLILMVTWLGKDRGFTYRTDTVRGARTASAPIGYNSIINTDCWQVTCLCTCKYIWPFKVEIRNLDSVAFAKLFHVKTFIFTEHRFFTLKETWNAKKYFLDLHKANYFCKFVPCFFISGREFPWKQVMLYLCASLSLPCTWRTSTTRGRQAAWTQKEMQTEGRGHQTPEHNSNLWSREH